VFPGGLTQNSHPSSADLKNEWSHNSTSLHSFVVCIWTEGGDTREQDTGQLNLPSVEIKSVRFHSYYDKQMKRGGSG